MYVSSNLTIVPLSQVKDLIGSKQKAQLRGKIIDKTTEERLTRNHEKLAQAEAAFLEARDSAMAQLLYCFEDTVYRLDLILLRVMQVSSSRFINCISLFGYITAPVFFLRAV